MRQLSLPLFAFSCCGLLSQGLIAQAPRQEARQERREARQDIRQDVRPNNRGTYYSDQTWTQLNPWVTKNNVQPARTAVGAAVNATANAVDRAANAGTNATNKAVDATQRAANATAKAAANTANQIAAGTNAAVNANARYGYSTATSTSPQGWFYDYYTYSPTYYSAPTSGSNFYGSASRYYDYNNDGIYDSLSTYRDTDTSGSYQVYDQLDFGTARTDDVAIDRLSDSRRHTVSGAIEALKLAKVNGSQNIVAKLSKAEGSSDALIVDLGPEQRWKSELQVKEGDKLSATGPIEKIGDKLVLIAESVTIGQQKEIVIARGGATLEGQVVDVTRAEVKGSEHVMVVIQSERDRRIVDLGPAERLKVKVEPQTKIVVQGVPVQFKDYTVVLADRIDLNGNPITIERW